MVDIGTSSMRGILMNQKGVLQHISQKEYQVEFKDNNYVEQDPAVFKDNLIKIIGESVGFAASNKMEIEALSITAQRSSIVPVDKGGEPLTNVIMWQDKRSVEICEKFEGNMYKIYEKTGLRVNPVFSAPKIMWLQEYMPHICEQTHKFLGIQDYIIHILTGEYKIDYSLASRTAMFNISTLEWDDELLDLYGIEKEKLCQVVAPGSICGVTNQAVYQLTGLKAGVPVITAGGDQQCAAIGLNAMEPGNIVVNSGTGSYVMGHVDQPIIDEEMRIVCNSSSIPGQWLLEASVLSTGNTYRWFRDSMYSEDGKEIGFEGINREIESSCTGANDLMFMPYLTGRGTPNWDPGARGAFCNVGLNHKRGDFVRAILEGITSELDTGVNILRQYIPTVDKVSTAGGLTKLEVFNQMQADMYNRSVVRYHSEEATARGGWIIASKTLKWFTSYQEAFNESIKGSEYKIYSPIKENVEYYEDYKERSGKICKGLYQTVEE